MKSQFTAGRIPAAAAGVQARGAQAAASRSSRVVLSCAALALGGLLVAGSAQAVDTPNDAHCRSATSARALLPSPWPATLRGG